MSKSAKNVRVVIFAMVLILSIPIFVRNIQSGLDNSWMYFLNWVPYTNFKFGRDVFFTYGPLGFLVNAQNIGWNLFFASIFWALLLGCNAYILFRLLFREKNLGITNTNLFLSLILLYVSLDVTSILRIDYYIIGTVLLALSAAFFCARKTVFFSIAAGISYLTLFIKFSDALVAISALGITALLVLLKDRRLGLRFIGITALVPTLFVVTYLLYNPSIGDIISYFTVQMEISSGYSVAMSLPYSFGVDTLALLSVVLLGLSFLFLARSQKSYLEYFLIFLFPLFFSYKHAFTRADQHVAIFYQSFLLFLSIMVLFITPPLTRIKFTRIKSPTLPLTCAVLLLILPSLLSIILVNRDVLVRNPVMVFNEITSGLKNKIDHPLQVKKDDLLPASIISEIGESSVTIFPSEISVAAAYSLNLKPLPLVQNYVANVPSLDKRNADFFAAKDAPQYILFSYIAIDDRIPLLETPLVWEAIYSNYEVAEVYESGTLLERRAIPLQASHIAIGSEEHSVQDKIVLPEENRLITFQANFELTLPGKIMRWANKVPEVYITIYFDNGSWLHSRIVPDNLQNGVIINYVPYSVDSFLAFMQSDTDQLKVEAITFDGPGLVYYEDDILVEFHAISYETDQ